MWDRVITIRFVLALALSGLFFAGCASISTWPERIIAGAASSELRAELSMVAETKRIKRRELVVRFPEKPFFGVGEYVLRGGAKQNLTAVAEILTRYPAFIIIVAGHTDNSGRESYNQWLGRLHNRSSWYPSSLAQMAAKR